MHRVTYGWGAAPLVVVVSSVAGASGAGIGGESLLCVPIGGESRPCTKLIKRASRDAGLDADGRASNCDVTTKQKARTAVRFP